MIKYLIIPLKMFAFLILMEFLAMTLYQGCKVVQNRNFIKDGTSTKYNPAAYKTLDSLITSAECDTVITLERTGCLGKCPVFKMALLSNGYVYFQGLHNVKRPGIHDTIFNKANLEILISKFYSSGFFNLRDKYDLTDCVGPTDLSSVALMISTPDTGKKVSFYIGCMDYAREGRLVTHLASGVEDISNVKGWIR